MIEIKEILKDIDSFFNFLLREFPGALKYEEKWKTYHLEIIKQNEKIGLVSKKDLHFIARKHFADSVLISKYIKEKKITDIGSGAGFPGIPMAILDSDKKINLIERNLKKSIFLKEMKILLGLKNINIIREDLSSLEEIPGDVLISRAANYENILKILKNKHLKNRKFYAVLPFKKEIHYPFKEILNPLTQEKFKLLEVEL